MNVEKLNDENDVTKPKLKNATLMYSNIIVPFLYNCRWELV